MIWKLQHHGPFSGEASVRVVDRRGREGMARVQYYPVCCVVGPVMEIIPRDEPWFPARASEVLDRRPTFR